MMSQKLVFSCQPRIFFSGLVTAVVVLIVGIVFVILWGKFVDTAEDTLFLILLILTVITTAIVTLILLIKWTARGEIIIDDFAIIWEVEEDSGKIIWSRPFKIQFWQSKLYLPIWGEGSANYSQEIPVIVFDLEQDGKRVSFFYDVSLKETKDLPQTELRG